jgi:AcrR family transcriptional regulator
MSFRHEFSYFDYLNKIVRLNVIFASFYKMRKAEESFESSNKANLIIAVAQKRFGLFGVEKTSMQEIANDLKLSKASLYYYFPDKERLYKAVVEKEQVEFLNNITKRILSIEEPGQLLLEYVFARLSYFRTLLNLSRLRLEAYSDLKPVFRDSIIAFKEKEMEIVKNIFEKGISSGKFSIKNTSQTASLFLDLLKGLRISVVNDKKMMIIEQEEYDQLLKKTLEFTEIFINGLKIK